MLPFELTKDTPYLALSGELWSVFYEYFNRNWPCYKGFLLYLEESSDTDILAILFMWRLDTLRPRQDGRHFADDIFKCIFMNENFWILKLNFTEICSLGCNWQYGGIGSDNGLVQIRQQDIIWSNDGMFYWHLYASLGLNELNDYHFMMTFHETSRLTLNNIQRNENYGQSQLRSDLYTYDPTIKTTGPLSLMYLNTELSLNEHCLILGIYIQVKHTLMINS